MSLKTFIRSRLKKRRKIIFINEQEDMSILDKELSDCSEFGLDTEFDWRTTYYPKISTVQICVKNKLFLIDCLKINSFDVLKNACEDKNRLKIFHSVRSDSLVLSKSLGIHTRNVFDIQVAEKLLSNEEIKSYGKIVKKFFYINLDKTETNSNWLKRPLSDKQIKYALEDVDYLLEIYGYQRVLLKKKSLFKDALTLSEQEADLGNQPLKKLRLSRQKNKLSKRNLEIFEWREVLAEENNVPPAYIFKNKYLKNLARVKADDINAKKKIITILGDSILTENFIRDFL
tara:strand:+ start:104 stop:964 length:861 start_codon:yes stop_codon:yes gene_type:complete